MEDQTQSTEMSGVESASVAGEQSQELVKNETFVSDENPGADTQEVAGPVKDEKDFSTALKAREAQLRQQMEKEYGERVSKAEQYQQNLERIAKFYGYESHDAYMEALATAEHERKIQAEAEKFGVPEEFIREELSPLKNEVEELRKEREHYKQQEAIRQVEAEVNALKSKYPDFPQYERQVFDMVLNGEVNSLETAYRLASYDDKLRQKEQEVLANVTKRSNNQVLSSNDGPSDKNFSIKDASLDDIKSISERVRRGERIVL